MSSYNYEMPNAFLLGQKAVIVDDRRTSMGLSHGFALNETVYYAETVKRPNGEIWHQFTNGKRSDHLVEGEFQILDKDNPRG
jgi:hypothetical protein